MERRTFLLGMGSVLVGACTTPGVPIPYAGPPAAPAPHGGPYGGPYGTYGAPPPPAPPCHGRAPPATYPHPAPVPPARVPPGTGGRPPYQIVSRSDWGAQPLKPNHDPMEGVTRITLHHTAEVPGMGAGGDAEAVRAIQRYHRDTKDWADIGYHWLIGRDGRVYEGRVPSAQGAHAE